MRITVLFILWLVSTIAQPAAAQALIDRTAEAFKQWSDCVGFHHEIQWITERKEALKLNGEMAFSACASEEMLTLSLISLALSTDEGRRQGIVEHYARRIALKRKLMEKSMADAKKSP